ncbi:hypothetical protein ABH920_007265 [Catenulispora sp. EB89]
MYVYGTLLTTGALATAVPAGERSTGEASPRPAGDRPTGAPSPRPALAAQRSRADAERQLASALQQAVVPSAARNGANAPTRLAAADDADAPPCLAAAGVQPYEAATSVPPFATAADARRIRPPPMRRRSRQPPACRRSRQVPARRIRPPPMRRRSRQLPARRIRPPPVCRRTRQPPAALRPYSSALAHPCRIPRPSSCPRIMKCSTAGVVSGVTPRSRTESTSRACTAK